MRRNDSIIITKPDKGSAGVISNNSDYTITMNSILHDETKFERVGPAAPLTPTVFQAADPYSTSHVLRQIVFASNHPRVKSSSHQVARVNFVGVKSSSSKLSCIRLPPCQRSIFLERRHRHYRKERSSCCRKLLSIRGRTDGIFVSTHYCCLQVGKMLYPPFKRVPLSISISANVTVGT